MADQELTEPARPSAASPAARRRTQVGLLVASCVALALTLAVVTGSHVLDGFDDALTDLVRGWADPLGWPVDLAYVIGRATDNLMAALTGGVLVIVLFAKRYHAAAALLAMSSVSGLVVGEVMKRAVGRTRPPGAEQYEENLNTSFPSGHAMVGIFLYLAAGVVLIGIGHHSGRRGLNAAGVVLVVIGPCIGLSRLVLGVHWPSDIIAGWAYGSMVLTASALILWWPLDRGWSGQGWRPGATPPPAPPESEATPGAPAG